MSSFFFFSSVTLLLHFFFTLIFFRCISPSQFVSFHFTNDLTFFFFLHYISSTISPSVSFLTFLDQCLTSQLRPLTTLLSLSLHSVPPSTVSRQDSSKSLNLRTHYNSCIISVSGKLPLGSFGNLDANLYEGKEPFWAFLDIRDIRSGFEGLAF